MNTDAYNWWKRMAQEHGAGLMSTAEAAAVLGVSRQSVIHYRRKGKLPDVPKPSWRQSKTAFVPVAAVLAMAERSIMDKAQALHRLGPNANAPVRRLLGLPPAR